MNIHSLTRTFLIDTWNTPVILFHLFLYHKRAKKEGFILVLLENWATEWRELPFPTASSQLINNIQLDEALKDHKIILPFLSWIQASGNDLPPPPSHNNEIRETVDAGSFKCKNSMCIWKSSPKTTVLFVDGDSIQFIDANNNKGIFAWVLGTWSATPSHNKMA